MADISDIVEQINMCQCPLYKTRKLLPVKPNGYIRIVRFYKCNNCENIVHREANVIVE